MDRSIITASGKAMVLACFALLVISLSTTQYADYDLWWHLKLGETVYNTGGIYSADAFSYTFGGQKQFNGEWLGDLIIFLFYKAGGFYGLNTLKLLVLLFAFIFLWLTLKNAIREKEAGFYASILTLMVVFLTFRFRLYVRPYLFSYLFFTLFIFIISHYDKNRKLPVLSLLPLIQIAWSNMSVGAIFGPLLLFFYGIGCVFKKRPDATVFAVFAAVSAAALLNPEATGIYTLAFNLASDPYGQTVGEYQPLSFDILWGFGLRYSFIYTFQILVVVSLIYFVFMKGWKNLYHLSLFLFFFAQTVRHVRMIDFFSLTAALFFIHPAEKLTGKLLSLLRTKHAFINPALSLLLLSVTALTLTDRTFTFGIGMKEDTFPDGALAFLDKNNIQGNMFNSYGLGGYILWRSPERKVFIDGRYRRLYSTELYGSYLKMLEDLEGWRAGEKKWDFEYAMLEYSLRTKSFPKHFKENPEWALVYWDNHSAVYLKRTGKNREIIDAHEYRVTKPNFYDFSYLGLLHSTPPSQLIEQINREIQLDPSNQEPRLAKVFLLYNMGKPYYDEAIRELDICQRLTPDLSMEHSALAFIMFERGMLEKAKEEIKRALKLDPNDPGAIFLKGKLSTKGP